MKMLVLILALQWGSTVAVVTRSGTRIMDRTAAEQLYAELAVSHADDETLGALIVALGRVPGPRVPPVLCDLSLSQREIRRWHRQFAHDRCEQ